VQRAERLLTARVNVAERDSDMGRLADLVTPQNAIHEIGVLGVDLTPAIRDTLQDLRGDKGIVVALVAAGTPFSQQGRLAPGDVIYEINGKAVDGVERLKSALAALPQNAPFVLHVEREGTLLYLSFKVER
jgi:serine protease Do